MNRHTPIKLANEQIEIRLDPASGRIMAARNVAKGLDLIQMTVDTPPWRLELADRDEWLNHFTDFACQVETVAGGKIVATLRWETAYDITLTSRITLPPDEPTILFTLTAENRGKHAIDKIEYPFIAGIGPLRKLDTSCYLAHSQGTGFLFRDPFLTFLPEPGPKQGLRYSPYPEGFNGSTMQFMAYYAENEGGFYFATRDSGKAMKWYNFFRDVETHTLMASIMHQNPNVVAGSDFAPDYLVEISALFEGNWYEAAERYKVWAVEQAWTEQGPLAKREARATWLLEDVGICTFGVNAAHDRSAWLDAFHQMAGTPVFHVLGPNWARSGQDYRGTLPGASLDDWHPAAFSKENLETIRDNGDYWGPFEFDLLCTHHGDRPEPVLESRQVLPYKKYCFDRYRFPFMCPATDLWHDFHGERDVRMVADNKPDAIYYDISVNNVLMACRSPHHRHRPGGGQEIADAFAEMYADTREAVNRAAANYVPLGAEMITELTIPLFDYYQARAEASPVSNFEADFWRQWLIEGKVEKIPLFAYVYHEYGPVRMDGWAKLSPEVGDIFYWVASRVTLWGGLFELNYEFSALETLNGQNDEAEEHYHRFEPRSYRIDPDKAAFVGEVARARSGWANPYLAYGVMRRPPHLDVPPVTLNYFLYNCASGLPHYEERGEISVPSVMCAAWNYRGEKAALLLVNLLTEPQTVQVPLNLLGLGLTEAEGQRIFQRSNEDETFLGEARAEHVVSLSLPSRKVIGLEVRPA